MISIANQEVVAMKKALAGFVLFRQLPLAFASSNSNLETWPIRLKVIRVGRQSFPSVEIDDDVVIVLMFRYPDLPAASSQSRVLTIVR